MFLYLAKTFWFLAQPLNLAIFLALTGAAVAFLGRRGLGLGLWVASAATLLLALSAWSNVGALLLQPLEQRHPRPDAPPAVDGIIVLGGAFEGIVNRARGGYELNAAGDRIVETAALARRYPQARIFITGGSGSIFADDATDAESGPTVLAALGVDAARIEVEGRSRDTYENAVFSRDILKPMPDQTWMLVTSAFHMPRSVGLFRKAGFNIVPWPADFRTTGREHFALWRDNSVDSMQNVTVAIREWIGLAAYRIAGRTDELLP